MHHLPIIRDVSPSIIHCQCYITFYNLQSVIHHLSLTPFTTHTECNTSCTPYFLLLVTHHHQISLTRHKTTPWMISRIIWNYGSFQTPEMETFVWCHFRNLNLINMSVSHGWITFRRQMKNKFPTQLFENKKKRHSHTTQDKHHKKLREIRPLTFRKPSVKMDYICQIIFYVQNS